MVQPSSAAIPGSLVIAAFRAPRGHPFAARVRDRMARRPARAR